MIIDEIKQKYKILAETYKYMSILSFESTNIIYDKLMICLKHEKIFIPSFAKTNIVKKRYIGARYIPIIIDEQGNIDLYKSRNNMTDNIYNMKGQYVLVASNSVSDLSKIKLEI